MEFLETDMDLSPEQTKQLSEAKALYEHLYHFSREVVDSIIDNPDIVCSNCLVKSPQLPYYVCLDCPSTTLCSHCESEGSHYRSHLLYKMAVEPPRSFSMRDHNIAPWQSRENSKFRLDNVPIAQLPYSYHEQLVYNSTMPITESEALYEVFKCLMTTVIEGDQSIESNDQQQINTSEPQNSENDTDGLFSVQRLIMQALNLVIGDGAEGEAPETTTQEQESPSGVWGAICKEAFCELFPSVYSSDKFLEDFFFAIYDTNEDGLVDFGEFVKAHIALTHTSDSEKVALSAKLLASAEFDDELGTYKFHACNQDTNFSVSLDRFIDILRRLLYSYYDMSKYIFADAIQLQEQQLRDERGIYEKVDTDSRLKSDIQQEKAGRTNRMYPMDPWVWSEEDAKWTDTRMNYNPLSRDIPIEGNVDNFRLEQIERGILEFRSIFTDVKNLTEEVSVTAICQALRKNGLIASTLVACMEASLI